MLKVELWRFEVYCALCYRQPRETVTSSKAIEGSLRYYRRTFQEHLLYHLDVEDLKLFDPVFHCL